MTPKPTVLDRFLAGLPLALLYLGLCCLYAWQAANHVSPTIFSDELELAASSRAIAETGNAGLRGEPSRAFPGVYAVLLAPVWWVEDVAGLYARYVAGTQRKTGVMARTADFSGHDDAVRERPAVLRTGSPYRVDIPLVADQQHWLPIDRSGQR